MVLGSRLQGPHYAVPLTATIAPLLLAIFGFGALRNTMMFVALYIAGAAFTAPFTLARLAATV